MLIYIITSSVYTKKKTVTNWDSTVYLSKTEEYIYGP